MALCVCLYSVSVCTPYSVPINGTRSQFTTALPFDEITEISSSMCQVLLQQLW